MPDGSEGLVLLRVPGIAGIAADDWGRLRRGGQPPSSPMPFCGLWRSRARPRPKAAGCPVTSRSRTGRGGVLGVSPLYAKTHSFGEYVFDWGWADAWHRAGGRYYPKLQCAVPFTPVPGPRLLVRPEARENGGCGAARHGHGAVGERGEVVVGAL